MLASFGERLAEQRTKLRYMQIDMCELTGVTRRTQYQYESGKSFPDTRYLSILMDHGFDVVYLLSGQEAPRNESIDEHLLRDVLVAVDHAIEKHAVIVNSFEKASIAALVFQVSHTSRAVDQSVVDRLTRLINTAKDTDLLEHDEDAPR